MIITIVGVHDGVRYCLINDEHFKRQVDGVLTISSPFIKAAWLWPDVSDVISGGNVELSIWALNVHFRSDIA